MRPPSGPLWVHEVKHDGFRLIVCRSGPVVRCFTRGGHNWADRFPTIVKAAKRLRAQSFVIDGEAVICRPDGLSDFNALRNGRRGHDVALTAFDLIEFHGEDLRDEQLADRKRHLARLLARSGEALRFNDHIEHDGAMVCEHACRMGLEGIVSTRLDSRYRSGPSKTWLKSKNPLSEAVRREREEEWN